MHPHLLVARIIGHHTTPQEGRVFAETKPKLAVFTHLVLLASERVAAVTVDELIAETRKIYDGPLEIGEDLMSFDILERVDLHRPDDKPCVAANFVMSAGVTGCRRDYVGITARGPQRAANLLHGVWSAESVGSPGGISPLGAHGSFAV